MTKRQERGGVDEDYSPTNWSDVRIKRQVKPRMAKAAQKLGIDQAKCFVRFFIDKKGKPEKVEIEKCDEVFHESLKKAAMKWRFYPMKSASGQKVKATFLLAVTFKLK